MAIVETKSVPGGEIYLHDDGQVTGLIVTPFDVHRWKIVPDEDNPNMGTKICDCGFTERMTRIREDRE